MKKELRIDCLAILLQLKQCLKLQYQGNANDIEAMQLLNEVITIVSDNRKNGMAINFALSRFYGGFNRIVGLQGMTLSDETAKQWRLLQHFFNDEQLKDYRLGGVVVGIG